MTRVFRFAEQASTETDGRPHRFEGVGVQFLRYQADQRARGAIGFDDVMAANSHTALARIGDAADDVDQRGLAGAIRAKQRENLAALDIQLDILKRLEAAGIGL